MKFRFCFAMLTISVLAGQISASLVINEVRIDQPSSDNDEFFELFADGMAFADLSDFTYIVIGDGSAGSGVIESVTTLPSVPLSSGGFFLVAESTFSLGTANQTATLNFENSDNVTHLLVSNFTGSNGADLDTDDDGTLDSTPWDSIIDSIAFIEDPSGGDETYSPNTIGPDGTFVPGTIFRDVDGTAGVFQIGDFSSLDANTPGATNVAVPEPSAFLFGTLICGVLGAKYSRKRDRS